MILKSIGFMPSPWNISATMLPTLVAFVIVLVDEKVVRTSLLSVSVVMVFVASAVATRVEIAIVVTNPLGTIITNPLLPRVAN